MNNIMNLLTLQIEEVPDEIKSITQVNLNEKDFNENISRGSDSYFLVESKNRPKYIKNLDNFFNRNKDIVYLNYLENTLNQRDSNIPIVSNFYDTINPLNSLVSTLQYLYSIIVYEPKSRRADQKVYNIQMSANSIGSLLGLSRLSTTNLNLPKNSITLVNLDCINEHRTFSYLLYDKSQQAITIDSIKWDPVFSSKFLIVGIHTLAKYEIEDINKPPKFLKSLNLCFIRLVEYSADGR